MSKHRFGVITLVILALALSLVCSTVPLTNDVPLIISPGTDGIATVSDYNIFITPSIVVDANTTFTDVVRLNCPAGYNDTIGIANLTINSDQIKELQIFVNYSNQKIILIHYQDGSVIQNNTFTLHSETEAIMGITIIPTPAVINAGPIDPIYYNIFCSYEVVGVCGVNITAVVFSKCGTTVDFGYTTWTGAYALGVDVTVHNNGTGSVNCTVSAYYQDGATWVQIGTSQNITSLAECNNETKTFSWSLAGLTQCSSYNVKANVTTNCGVSDEFTTTIFIRLTGDADGAGGEVSILDVGTVCSVYALPLSDQQKATAYPFCDLDGNCGVDILDVGTVCSCYAAGYKCP